MTRQILQVGDWKVYYSPPSPSGHETVVLIHENGPFTGGSLELDWDGRTGRWSQFWSIGPEDSDPLTAAQVVTTVFDLIGVEADRNEVFLAGLASRYTPNHLIAAITGSFA